LADLLTALAVVFLAELGDKTQLVLLTAGTKQPVWRLLAALSIAIAALQGLSVTIGAAVGDMVGDRTAAIGSGILFCAFAVWTWREAGRDHGGSAAARGGLAAVVGAFVLAELGDKSTLASASLAADRGMLAVWIGGTIGFIAATAVALTAGRALARRVSPRTLGRAGAVAFALVGIGTLVAAVGSSG
jgi:putative Ca2+/H+ antiporter (TMEM165/GDT1 family)